MKSSEKNISNWLREGEQSKLSPYVKKVCSSFKGDEFDKILGVMNWIEKNMVSERDRKKILKIFATRNTDQIIKQKNSTGCHDSTIVAVTFLRAVGIPAKYLLGMDKIRPKSRGHCVVEAYVRGRWILIDPTYFKISFIPSRTSFYKDYYILKEGLDSWDCGVKTLEDWKNVSLNLIKGISKNTVR